MLSVMRYSMTNAVMRAMLTELLASHDFETLLRADTSEDAWQALRRTGYGEWLPEAMPAGLFGVERVLQQVTASRFSHLARTLKGKTAEVGELLLSRWELDSLETALRLWQAKDSSVEELLACCELVHGIPFRAVFEAEAIEGVARALSGTPYAEPIQSVAAEYEEKKSVFYIEVALERDYYRRLRDAMRELGGKDARTGTRIIGAEVDLINLGWLGRLVEYYKIAPHEAKRFMIEGGSEVSGRLADSPLTPQNIADVSASVLPEGALGGGTALERLSLLEHIVTEMTSDLARSLLLGYPFTIACVLSLYFLKRIELRNLRAVFAGKAAGLEAKELMLRLCGVR